MIWTQSWPKPAADKAVSVTVVIEGADPTANRQLSMFLTDMVRNGVTICGYDTQEETRAFKMETLR